MNITLQELDKLECLHTGVKSRLYLIENSPYDKKPVVLKMLQQAAPTAQQIARFYNEFTITKALDIPGVRRAYAQTSISGHPALVLSYVPGPSFKEAFIRRRHSLAEMLRVAIAIAQTLAALHQHNIIHKDIN